MLKNSLGKSGAPGLVLKNSGSAGFVGGWSETTLTTFVLPVGKWVLFVQGDCQLDAGAAWDFTLSISDGQPGSLQIVGGVAASGRPSYAHSTMPIRHLTVTTPVTCRIYYYANGGGSGISWYWTAIQQ